MKHFRADDLLCAHGHASGREEAAVLIMAGLVRSSADNVVRKPSELFPEGTVLAVEEKGRFVSRGARKLEQAMTRLSPDLTGNVCADVGASTGGFTDLMLSLGAEKVFAVDVGKGLLHWKLRTDPRVVVLEGTNARNLAPELFNGEKVDLLTMDVSFISATKILEGSDSVMKSGALAFLLVKPQFEAPKKDVPPGGVVTDETVRRAALQKVLDFIDSRLAWTLVDVSDSPLKGPKGNLEFVAVFRKK